MVCSSVLLLYNDECHDNRNVVWLPTGGSRPSLFPARDAVRRVFVGAPPRRLVSKARHVLGRQPHRIAHLHDSLQLIIQHYCRKSPSSAHHHHVTFHRRDLSHRGVGD
jgi:hypothetical protein